MKTYRYRVASKPAGTEVNIARTLQAVDFGKNPVQIEEHKLDTYEKTTPQGPRKTTVTVGSRRYKEEAPPAEYTLKCFTSEKPKTWIGKSEASSKYAILTFHGSEVVMVLTDHWYKFSPVFQTSSLEIEQDIKLGKVIRKQQEAAILKDVIGDDSDEEKPKKRVHLPRKKEFDEDSEKEDMDFEGEFSDDDEQEASEDADKEKVRMKLDLSSSGKELRKVLIEKEEEEEKDESSSGIGLSDEEEEKEGISEQAVINELMRLGRTTLKELVNCCTRKFKAQGDQQKLLSKIIRTVGDINGKGESAEVTLKEEYKKSLPVFRAKFQAPKRP